MNKCLKRCILAFLTQWYAVDQIWLCSSEVMYKNVKFPRTFFAKKHGKRAHGFCGFYMFWIQNPEKRQARLLFYYQSKYIYIVECTDFIEPFSCLFWPFFQHCWRNLQKKVCFLKKLLLKGSHTRWLVQMRFKLIIGILCASKSNQGEGGILNVKGDYSSN